MISLIIITIAGILNGSMDFILFHKKSSINDWQKKYKQPLQPAPRNLYYSLLKITWKEKFPLSASALVFLTDTWHLLQFFFLNLIVVAIILHSPIVNPIADFFILKACMTSAKQITLSILKSNPD